MTDYSKPQRYDPSDFDEVQRRRFDAEQATLAPRQNRYSAGGNLVLPAQREPVRAYPLPEPMEAPAIVPAATTQAIVRGDYRDRAAGFNIKTAALAATVGVTSAIVGVVGFGTPILSLGVLAWLGGGFFGTWLIAYLVDAATSPEGAALFGTWRAWRWLDREQAHRHYIEERSRWPEDWK